jgi:prolyl 4-hydroxylase
MISLEDRKLRGGPELKPRIWDEVKTSLEEWTGMDVTPTSLYGIRVYKEGSMLAPHVDRMPLVTSAIIQVSALA